MQIPNISFFRTADPSHPDFGWRLAQSLDALERQSTNIEQQGNLNPLGQPVAPPNIQSVTATGANGWLHIAVQDQSAGLARGVEYFAEHSAFPDFRDAQIRPMGTSRQIDLAIGNATRYVRAYSAYPGSMPSAHVYHGSATVPIPVSGGGAIGPPAWLPSQGSGTGAPGQSGVGPGPLPRRTVESGVQWTGQTSGPAGLLSAGAYVVPGGSTGVTGSSGGGGGGIVVIPLIDTYANWTLANYNPINYPAGTTFIISDRSNVVYIVKIVAGSPKWVYESGTYKAVYASKPTTGFNGVALGTNDAGLLFYDNVNYIRKWEWTGSAWTYAAEELPGGDTSPALMILAGNSTPPGWAPCNGGAVTITKSDATTVSFTTPNPASLFFEGGAYTGSPIAAVAPAISGSTASATTGITLGSTGAPSATQAVQSGLGATVASSGHTHAEGSPSDPGHSHGAGSLVASATGTPAAIALPLYIKL